MSLKFHFISGLPRSGSTLLSAMLRQNPRFHAGMTSPLGAMYMAMEGAMSRRSETSVFLSSEKKRDILYGLFESYYKHLASENSRNDVVFDTNRVWCAKLPALTQLFPTSRIICCVRDIAWIMDSLERIHRKNSFELSALTGFDTSGTVYTRVNRFAAGDGLVGYALDALKEAFFGEQAGKLVLVEYEALVRAPKATLTHLYDALEEPYFSHDFENVFYEAEDFDVALGAPGLHTVRKKVEWVDRQTILPPELFARFGHDMFWRGPALTLSPVTIIRPDDAGRLENKDPR